MRILVIAEHREQVLRGVSHELLAAARALDAAASVDALLCAPGPVAGAESLGAHGADRVLLATHDGFARSNPDGLTAVVASLAPQYAVVLFAASATGRDVAPRVAARLRRPLASDATSLAMAGGALTAVRPVYAGKILQTVTVAGAPAIATVRPGAYQAVSAGKAGAVEAVAVPAFEQRVTVTGVKKPDAARPDVTEASIVVSGGRGLKEPEHFRLVEELADAFGGAAVGASRAVVDAGWRDHGEQVGQTGKTVSPQLYVAIGISGAIQHLAGMRTARTIVAINRDKDAPIFKVADYGIVGDLFEIVPRLTEEVRKVRSRS